MNVRFWSPLRSLEAASLAKSASPQVETSRARFLFSRRYMNLRKLKPQMPKTIRAIVTISGVSSIAVVSNQARSAVVCRCNSHLGLYLVLNSWPATTPAMFDQPFTPIMTLLVPFQGVLPAIHTASSGPPTNTPAMHTCAKPYRTCVSVEVAITMRPMIPKLIPPTVCIERSRK